MTALPMGRFRLLVGITQGDVSNLKNITSFCLLYTRVEPLSWPETQWRRTFTASSEHRELPEPGGLKLRLSHGTCKPVLRRFIEDARVQHGSALIQQPFHVKRLSISVIHNIIKDSLLCNGSEGANQSLTPEQWLERSLTEFWAYLFEERCDKV